MTKRVLPSSGGDFTPAPAGLHAAICVDVIDKGWVQTPWGRNPKVAIVWQIDKTLDVDGEQKPFLVSAWYTMSIHEKANLRKMLESWFSTRMDDEQIEADGGIDLDLLVGRRCALTVGHVENKEGKTRAIVQAVSPLAEGMRRLDLDGSYTRQEDRDTWEPPVPSAFGPISDQPGDVGGAEDGPPPPEDSRDYSGGDPDDDVPF